VLILPLPAVLAHLTGVARLTRRGTCDRWLVLSQSQAMSRSTPARAAFATAAALVGLFLAVLLPVGLPAALLPIGLSAAGPAGASPPSAGLFAGGGVSGFGDAPTYGSFAGTTMSAPAVAMASTPTGQGYWVAGADGGVFAFGDAGYYGSTGSLALYAPIVGMAATPDGEGYWLVAQDGGIFAFGDASFYGSMGGTPLNRPIVGMAVTPNGLGYWLVASDGGIFAFGNAQFYGSTGGIALQQPITGIASTDDGGGYWMVAADGGIFTFGDAQFYGSASGQNLGASVVGIAPTADDHGYWLVAATAGVLTFGDARFDGPSPNLPPFSPTAAIVATPDGGGYWLLQPADVPIGFTNPSPGGGAGIVATAASQVGPDPSVGGGAYCNPYGPCEEWCALFATWVWRQQGVAIPQYPFTGSIDEWGAARGLDLAPTAVPSPGDAVLFGTGPSSTATSVHVGIVAQVWPNGAIISVEGDAGPEPDGKGGVIVNGPYLPSDSLSYNGVPIYAFVQP
jgi:hypothetical protein